MKITTPITLQALLDLVGARRSGDSWVGRCPAHKDRTPSLSVCERDGKILLHCFAGCTYKAICSALGIENSALFTAPQGSPRVLATYDYTDERGGICSIRQFVTSRKISVNAGRTGKAAGFGIWMASVACSIASLKCSPQILC